MPLNLSMTHIMVVGIVALVVLGPDRLPGVAKTAGQFWREWKRIRGDLEGDVREAINEFKEPFREHIDEFKGVVTDVTHDIRHGPAPTLSPSRAANTGPAPLDVLPPLAAALPALGPSSGLVSPGPVMSVELPELAPPPEPDTFVPFAPGD